MTRNVSYIALATLIIGLARPVQADGWMQWGRIAEHESASPATGQRLDRIDAEVVIDPFAQAEWMAGGRNLLVHYQVPLVDGPDVFTILKTGTFTAIRTWETQIWNVRNLRWQDGQLVTRWLYQSDWKPVPFGSPSWEPVYHCALTRDAVWAPGAGGTIDKISRADGTRIARINPFGTQIDPTIFVSGPPTIDRNGNVYYNAIQLNATTPWGTNVANSWLVRIGADGSTSIATITSLTPDAPAALAQCATTFPATALPFPPSTDAKPPTAPCGSQRPGINVAPAVADDGTIYTISRAHFVDRYAYLIAANPDLTPKWSASLRERFLDGCNVLLPPNGTPGGCRAGARTGVDPSENAPGSGRVLDDATSSPAVTPDGKILYGAYTRYNYRQGHLMMFGPDGTYVGSYPWGWDLTPAIYRHDGTWSILLKENHYITGSYCSDSTHCPPNRTVATPNDPEAYFITQLSPMLGVEWRHQNRNTMSCSRGPDGVVACVSDHPNGFEWCVNAIAVDRRGVVYANSEDGNLYAIDQGGTIRQNIFLRLATGASYTPLSIGEDGRIYSQNDGDLFVVGGPPRRRAAR